MNKKQKTKKLFYLPSNYLVVLTAIMTLFVCSEVSAANASAADVHDLADICMYSQRVLKDYALVGMKVTYHDPKSDLEKNIATVDKYFQNLKSHKLNEKLTAEILEIEKSWNAIKPAFEKTPDKSNMSELRHKVEEYTVRCEEVAEDLAKDTGIKGEHNVVLVAELGMESQRLAALYLMKAWGVADPDYDEEVKQVIDQSEKIYEELMNADVKLVSTEIKELLKSTEKDFLAFGVMAKSTSGRFMPSAAEKSASKIFTALRDILKREQKLVEGSISGYFIPVADEKNVEKIFKTVSEISSLNKEEIGS